MLTKNHMYVQETERVAREVQGREDEWPAPKGGRAKMGEQPGGNAQLHRADASLSKASRSYQGCVGSGYCPELSRRFDSFTRKPANLPNGARGRVPEGPHPQLFNPTVYRCHLDTFNSYILCGGYANGAQREGYWFIHISNAMDTNITGRDLPRAQR